MFCLSVLLLALLVSGCSSLGTWVKSNLEGVPVWVYEPQVGRNQTAFVGKGSAATDIRARVLAYESILAQLSSYIGEDVAEKHIAQLSSRGAIEEYRLKVTQEFVKPGEGSVSVWFLAVADRTVLDQARTESEVQLLARQREMEVLESEAVRFYRENKDLLAASRYLEVAWIARSLPVDRGASRYAEAIARVRSILLPLTISVAPGSPGVPTTMVTVRRGNRPLSPRVAQAPVAARAEARNGLGERYGDVQRFVTDPNGQFTFRTSNPTLVGTGEVVFEINFSSELEPLRAMDPEMHAQLVRLLESKRINYPYERIAVIGGEPLVIAVHEYSLQGQLLDSTHAAAIISRSLAEDGMRAVLTSRRPTDDEDLAVALRAAHPGSTHAILGEVGISHRKEVERGATVSVTGELSLVDLRTLSRLGSTGTVTANAMAPTMEEAGSAAFSRFGAITTSMLYRFLYR